MSGSTTYTYKYWQFGCSTNTNGTGNTDLAEVQFFNSTGNLISLAGGTASGPSTSDRYPAFAFDGDENTYWEQYNPSGTVNLVWEFAEAETVYEINFFCRGGIASGPGTIIISGSNDGTTWTEINTFTTSEWQNGTGQNIILTYFGPVLNLTQSAIIAATTSIPNVKFTQTSLLVATTSIPRFDLTQTALLVATTVLSDDTSYQHIALAQKPTGDQIVELFTLDCSSLGLGVYWWTPGEFTSQPYIYQGITYTPFPVEMQGWSMTSQGTQPRPKLSVSNYGGFVGSLVAQNGDLLGAKLTCIRTYARFLDNGVDPDPNAHWAPEVFFVDRKSAHGKKTIEWELATPLEQKNIRIPGRLCIKNYCYFRYRVYNAAANNFTYNQTVAACPYTGPSYFDTKDQPTTDPSKDACSNQLTGCIARYGIQAAIPFGGFPGMIDGAGSAA